MTGDDFFNKQISYYRCVNARNSKSHRPATEIFREDNDIAIIRLGRGKRSDRVNAKAMERALYWNRQQRCFGSVLGRFLQSTVDARGDPVRDVSKQTAPIVTFTELLVRFVGT